MMTELTVHSNKILHVPFYLNNVFCLFKKEKIDINLFCDICSKCIQDSNYLYFSRKWKKIILDLSLFKCYSKKDLDGLGIDSYFWRWKSEGGYDGRPFVTLFEDRPRVIDVVCKDCLQKVVEGLGYNFEFGEAVDFGISCKLTSSNKD